MILKRLSLSLLLAFASGLTAGATVYTDKTDFLNAASVSLVTSFDDLVASGNVDYPAGSSLVVNGNLTLSAPGNLTLWGEGVFPPSALVDADGYFTSLTLSFAQGVDSIGFDYGVMHNASPDIAIEVYDAVSGGNLLYTTGAFSGPYIIDNPFGFFGISDVGAIGRVVITGGHAIAADNVYMTAAIPEPSAYAAVAASVALGLAACRRRRKG